MAETGGIWGEESIRLTLPATWVAIEGLSSLQRDRILADFADFAHAAIGAGPIDAVCRVGRLEQLVRLPDDAFEHNGEYTPLKRRSGGEISVTGLNSVGALTRNGTSPVRATLAVAEEMALPTAFVLENFLRILSAYRSLDQGGVLLHSVGIVQDGRAYLFCGRSNVGKSTLARKGAALGHPVLSDDINLVLPEAEGRGYRAHKVPFTGEFGRRAENLSGPGAFPLAGLALLEQSPVLRVAPVTAGEAVARLMTGCPFVNDDPDEFPALMDVLTGLVDTLPVVRLGVARDDPFDAVMAALLERNG
jgi:hypothetical protein